MYPKDVDALLENWRPGEAKVFYYYDYWPWRQRETIIIHRESAFKFITLKEKSTVNAGSFDDLEMKKLLGKETLVERPYSSVNTNYMEEKTGGCECGGWITGPNVHSWWCRKYRNG